MKTRWAFLAAAVLALIVGFAFGARSDTAGEHRMDRTHGSAAMQRMHAQMPADLQAECSAMHAQMGDMGSMGGGGMMSSGGMMGR